MKILITNDDGINAIGINALAEVFSKEHEVYVVAPETERSAFSHSVTIFNKLKYNVLEDNNKFFRCSTSGTPADCVKFSLLYLLKDKQIDCLISGINNGPNVGTDVMYSGTVGAAFEGVFLGMPSFAISLTNWNEKGEKHYEAAQFLLRNFEELIKINKTPHTILNINYPAPIEYKGAKIVKAGINLYSDYFELSDIEDNTVSLKGMPIEHDLNDGNTDVCLTKKGYATISPLHLDRNNYKVLESIKDKAKIE